MPSKSLEQILFGVDPNLELPTILSKENGTLIKPNYRDELLATGYGLEIETILDEEVFFQLRDNIDNMRSALFALCNRYGVIFGSIDSQVDIGTLFTRAQDEVIWHVDRSNEEAEYYTLLLPADCTVAKTRITPLMHFLRSVREHTNDISVTDQVITDISAMQKATGVVTDQITEIAEEANKTLNGRNYSKKQKLASAIDAESVLIGGTHGWLMFSDPLVIHTGDNPTGSDKHVRTFDLANKGDGYFYSVYA